MYIFLNIFFYVFHTVLVVFNVFGWLWPRTRRWNLGTLLLTSFSWFVMGLWYGMGYCLCTDWQWRVRRHLGYSNDPHTFIDLLLRDLTGVQFSPTFVYNLTAIVFAVSLLASVSLNLRDYLRIRLRTQSSSSL